MAFTHSRNERLPQWVTEKAAKRRWRILLIMVVVLLIENARALADEESKDGDENLHEGLEIAARLLF